MNPTTPILAIDLGKFNSVFYWFQSTTGEGVFRSVKTNSDSLRRELTRQPIDCVVVAAFRQAPCNDQRLRLSRRGRRVPRATVSVTKAGVGT